MKCKFCEEVDATVNELCEGCNEFMVACDELSNVIIEEYFDNLEKNE